MDLFVEKYRPKTLSEYVFRDDHQRKQVEQWVKEKTIPHTLDMIDRVLELWNENPLKGDLMEVRKGLVDILA